MIVTLALTENAWTYLRAKVKGRVGFGAFVSTLLTAEQAREECRALVAQKSPKPTRQSWDATGLRVD